MDDYKSLTIPFAGGKSYRLLGRARQTEKDVLLDWSADGVEFSIDCEGTIAVTAYTSGSQKNTYKLRVIVDGVVGDRVIFPWGTTTLDAFTGVAPGVHTIRIVKDSALMYAEERLLSVTVRAKEGTMKATAPKEKLLEVIGDSISCGYGIMPTDTPETTMNTASSVLTFGYRVAEALNMDYELAVKGSLGFVHKAGKPVERDMFEIYPYQNRYRDTETRYDFPRKADLILQALGSNDGDVPDDVLEDAVRRFTAQLREIHGEHVPIVYMYGMMNSKIGWLYEKLAKELPDSYALQVTENRLGAGHHPTLEGQERFAEEALTLVRKLI